jgi:hypothetical protein
LLSDVPEGSDADIDDNLTLLVNSEHNNAQNDGGDQQQWWVAAFDGSVGIWRQGSSGENGLWQWRQQVISVARIQCPNISLIQLKLLRSIGSLML